MMTHMKIKFGFCILTGLILLGAVRAFAGVVLENQQSLPNGKTTVHSLAWVDDSHLRVDIQEKNKDLSYIYDQTQGKLWVLDHRAKHYREIDPLLLEKQAAKGYDLVPVNFALHGPGESSGAWLCKVYEGSKASLTQNKLWTVDPRQLNLSPEAYKTLQGARAYLQAYAPEAAAFFHAGSRAWENNQGYSGVPVRLMNYSKDGKLSGKIELTKAEAQDISLEKFVVPAGYKKVI